MPTAADAPTYFGRDLEAMSFAVNYHRWILDEFRPFLGQHVAEVGAGTGNVTEMVLPLVKRLVAFEPSGNMFPQLARRLAGVAHAEARNGIFAAAGFAGQLDSVLYVNVLEHVEDDRAEVQLMREALKPGGHALIFVPALSWLYSNLDRQLGHYRRYHRASLASLFSESGFEVLRCRYFDWAGVLPWYVAFVLLRRTISAGNVSAYDRFVVPCTRAVESLIPPPFGKNLLLIARRR